MNVSSISRKQFERLISDSLIFWMYLNNVHNTTLLLLLSWQYFVSIFSPLPVKPGDSRLCPRLSFCLSVCPSVCPSVRQSVRPSVHWVSVHAVFRTFLSHPLRYWLEIWYMNLSCHNTDQVRVSLRLTYFYKSYCPLLKSSFPDFSLPSFEILTWNLVYEFVF